MDKQNNTPTANPLEVAVRDLCGKVDAYLKQGCLRSELYKVNERVKALLDTLPEQPASEGLDDAAEKYREYREKCGINDPIMLVEIADAYYAGAEWQAEQGESYTAEVIILPVGIKKIQHTVEGFEPGDKVIVQIRKK